MEFRQVPTSRSGQHHNMIDGSTIEMKFLDGVIAQMRTHRGLGACIDTYIRKEGESLSDSDGYRALVARRRHIIRAAKRLSYLDVRVFVRSTSRERAELWIMAESLF